MSVVAKRPWLLAAVGVALLGTGVLVYQVGQASAEGVPTGSPLYFSGTITEGGALVEGSRDLTVRVWDLETGGTNVCTTTAAGTTVQAGRFRIALDAACTTAVQADPDLWVEVQVDSTPLPGRMKLGAVPYALESGRTVNPVGSIMAYAGSTAPPGWLSCDGSAAGRSTYPELFAVIGTSYGEGDGSTTFGLPDLRQRFPLGKADAGTASTTGETGGTFDHTHAILPEGTVSQPTFSGMAGISDSGGVDHTHSGPAHTHDVNVGAFTSGSGSAHSHGAGSYVAEIGNAGTNLYLAMRTTGSGYGTNRRFTVLSGSWESTTESIAGTTVVGTGGAESAHSHSVDPPNTGSTSSGAGATGGASAYYHVHGFVPAGTVSQPTFAGTAGTTGPENPPFLVVNYIIKF